MKHKKILALALAVLLLVGTFAACGNNQQAATPAETPEGGQQQAAPPAETETGELKEFVVRIMGDPFSLTPNHMLDEFGADIHDNLFSKLVKLDANNEVIPDLAYRWEYSDDMETLTFRLHQNAYWHDGTPVTSADVKYTFDTIAATPHYFFSAQMGIVDEIETPDDHTVIFHLNTPDASFVAFLGWIETHILPRHIFDIGMPWGDNPVSAHPIGSGAFMFYSYDEGQSVVLVRNPNYFGGPVPLDRLIFAVIPDEATAVQALLSGEIDHMREVPMGSLAELEAHPHLNVQFADVPAPARIVFNFEDELAGNPAVRRAIAYAMNRQQISNMAYFGVFAPEYTMYPSAVAWASNPAATAPSFNTERAIEILEEAGFTRDADGYFFDFSLDYFPMLTGATEIVQLLQAQLSAAGIRLEILSLEIMAYIMRAEGGEFQAHLISGFLGPDPSAFVARFGEGQAVNFGNYANAEFDNYIRQGNAIADQARRATYYWAAQEIMAEELPHLPIVAWVNIEVTWDHFTNLPTEGAGRWGWTEFSHTDLAG